MARSSPETLPYQATSSCLRAWLATTAPVARKVITHFPWKEAYTGPHWEAVTREEGGGKREEGRGERGCW